MWKSDTFRSQELDSLIKLATGLARKPAAKRPRTSSLATCLRAAKAQGLSPTSTIVRPDGTYVVVYGGLPTEQGHAKSDWDQDLGDEA